jgi:hypothetical protein
VPVKPSHDGFVFFEIVLPNPNDLPSQILKSCIDYLVPCSVALEFLLPEVSIRHRSRTVLRARMPEATVYEDSNPDPWKHKVWLAKKVRVAAPSSNAVRTHDRHECEFRRLVAATFDPRHDLGPLF